MNTAFIDKLKIRAKAVKRDIAALYYAYGDPAMPQAPKLLILLTLGYALSPIDLIPDFIPVIGYLDDLIIVPALIRLSVRMIPADVMDSARKRAVEKPLRLSKNWGFAVFFVLLWIALVAWIASFFFRHA
jgi:uncharacterized membrane protein YkvA (DUF1232 family)